MKILPTVNISKHNYWLVICIAKNLIRFSQYLDFFAPSQIFKYCSNHASMEILLFSFQMMYKLGLCDMDKKYISRYFDFFFDFDFNHDFDTNRHALSYTSYLFLHILLVFALFFILLHILLFISFFYLYIYIYIYIYIYALVWCYFYIIFILCTVHWADLIWSTFHFWLYPV